MIRVNVIVEGQTERSFVNELLVEFLVPHGVLVTPILLGVTGHKGGRTNYARVRGHVLKLLRGDPMAYCSTMLDFYGLGKGFPGIPIPPMQSNIGKVTHLERAMQADIGSDRFLPYLQLHEYEGLLFSDPASFADALRRNDLAAKFQRVRERFATPEDINDDPSTAPSKIVLEAHPGYQKVLDGILAARRIGIDVMRQACPHFRDWIARLLSVS